VIKQSGFYGNSGKISPDSICEAVGTALHKTATLQNVGAEVLIAPIMKSTVSWTVMPSSSARAQHSAGSCHLHVLYHTAQLVACFCWFLVCLSSYCVYTSYFLLITDDNRNDNKDMIMI
jgi:hypothetical protein